LLGRFHVAASFSMQKKRTIGDGDSDFHRHDWQVNTIDGPTKLVRQDAILGGLSIGQ